jgi:hypothetical protein
MLKEMGVGGESLPVFQPQIQPGSQEIKIQVNITYEIR